MSRMMRQLVLDQRVIDDGDAAHGACAMRRDSEESSAVPAGREAEPVGDALADIGEGRANANRCAAAMARGEGQDRHLLAGVVGAAPGRVVAVVGGQDQQIVRAQRGDELGQPGVEGLERRGVAGDVAAVAVDRVEIDEVGEDEVAVAGHVDGVEGAVEQRHVAAALDLVGDAVAGEDVGDLADGVDLAGRPLDPVEQRRLGRRDREVAAVAGAVEARRGLADERPGDDTADRSADAVIFAAISQIS